MLDGCIYFIFIFISSSVPRFSMKKSVNQLIKNKRPYRSITIRLIAENGVHWDFFTFSLFVCLTYFTHYHTIKPLNRFLFAPYHRNEESLGFLLMYKNNKCYEEIMIL